jgi:hypothetical protein
MDKKKEKLKKHISNFNECLQGVIVYLGNILQDSFFAQHRKEIQCIFVQEPDEPIAYFLEFVYAIDKYRINILNRNEEFMINESFEDSIDQTFSKGLINKYDKNAKNYAMDINKKKYIKKIFDFKEAWIDLNITQKTIIQDLMIKCVNICDKYVLLQDKINRYNEKNKHKNKHKNKNNEKTKRLIDIDDISTSSTSSKE